MTPWTACSTSFPMFLMDFSRFFNDFSLFFDDFQSFSRRVLFKPLERGSGARPLETEPRFMNLFDAFLVVVTTIELILLPAIFAQGTDLQTDAVRLLKLVRPEQRPLRAPKTS